MKRLLTVGVVFLCVATSALSQTLTAADRERGMQYLESTRQAVLDATAGLSEAQWNFKSAPDRWSVAEVVEHIAAAEDFLMAMVTNQVMKGPARPAGDDVKAIDDIRIALIPTENNATRRVVDQVERKFRSPIHAGRPVKITPTFRLRPEGAVEVGSSVDVCHIGRLARGAVRTYTVAAGGK